MEGKKREEGREGRNIGRRREKRMRYEMKE